MPESRESQPRWIADEYADSSTYFDFSVCRAMRWKFLAYIAELPPIISGNLVRLFRAANADEPALPSLPS
jgi:hypothetical protein